MSSDAQIQYEEEQQQFVQRKLSELDEDQLKALKAVQDHFAGFDVSAHADNDPYLVLDVPCMLRFLRARNFSVKETIPMIQAWIDWRIAARPHCVTSEQVEEELIWGKAYWHGRDKQGNPCIIVNASKHFADYREVEQCTKFIYYCAERGIAQMKPPVERYCIIYEPEGLSRKNFDLVMVKKFREVGNYYPERLDKIFVVKPNWLYKMLLKLASTLMDPIWLEKIVLVDDCSQLLDYFTPENLLVKHGGTSQYEYKFVPTRKLREVPGFDLSEYGVNNNNNSNGDGDKLTN